MGLLPNKEQPNKESPAARLAKMHAKVVGKPGLSTVEDFRKLLIKFKYDDIVSVLKWLAEQPTGIRVRPSSWFIYKFRWLKVQAAEDLSGYPVGDVSDLRRAIEDAGGSPIPDTFIQNCWDFYAAFLEHLRTEPDGVILYSRMPPPREFVVQWFSIMVPQYSKAYRKFSTEHEKFRGFFYRIADACSSRREADKMLKAYHESQKRS